MGLQRNIEYTVGVLKTQLSGRNAKEILAIELVEEVESAATLPGLAIQYLRNCSRKNSAHILMSNLEMFARRMKETGVEPAPGTPLDAFGTIVGDDPRNDTMEKLD